MSKKLQLLGKKLKPPIFIGGEGRSGTRLLRTVLGKHSNIFEINRETYIFASKNPQSKRIHERLVDKNDFDTLTLSILTGTIFRREVAYEKTKHSDFPEDALKAFNEIRALDEYKSLTNKYDAFDLAINYLTIKEGKNRWVEKTPYNIYSFDEILDSYPDAKLLLIFRDPRPVCASWLKKDSNKSLIGVCLNWNRAVKEMNKLLMRYPEQVQMVKYEDLVSDSERTVRDICRFIGESYEEQMLEIDVVNSQYQERGAKGFSDHGFQRWMERLSNNQIFLINMITAANRTALGYLDEVPIKTPNLLFFVVFILKELIMFPANKFLKFTERFSKK